MKIVIAGSRGIPAAYGGFETFAEEIGVRLAETGLEVTVICGHADHELPEYKNVKLIYSGYSKARHPLNYYYDNLKRVPADTEILLVCGVGGALFYPAFRKKGRTLVTHVDGREELRGKYSAAKKMYVRLAQKMTAHFSDHIIADGFAVKNHWKNKFSLPDKKISAIEFGADHNFIAEDPFLEKYDLEKDDYYLVVCRMVPENNVELMIRSFLKSGSKKKMVLVGNNADDYGHQLGKYSSPRVVFLDGIYDRPVLFTLRKNCFAYLHGHSVGGTNPSLLEAMAAGNLCICHDNEFNRETTNGGMFYFRTEEDLAAILLKVEETGKESFTDRIAEGLLRIKEYYNWTRITGEYIDLFKRLRGTDGRSSI